MNPSPIKSITVCALAIAGTATAQAFTYDFNISASDFSPTTFTSNLPGGATATWSANSGISGSGSFSTNGVSNQTEIYNTGLANFTGAVFTTSFFFETRPTSGAGDLVGFGYFNSTTQLFDAGNLIGYKINGTNASSLANSTWYQLVATTTNTGSVFHSAITLQSYGANGTTPTGGLIPIPSSDSTGGTLLTTPSIYVGIYGGGGTQGGFASDFQTPAIDNFSVSNVPEPTSSVLLLGSGAMLLLRRRRASAV